MMRYVILGLLRDGRARHGYAMMKEYRDTSGRSVSVGNIYRELQRLRTDGMVKSGENPPGADPRRLPYAITELGAREFDRWLERPGGGGLDMPDDEYSMRAFFGWHAAGDAAQRVLADWSEELRSHARILSRTLQRTTPNGNGGALSTFALWVDRRLRHLAIDLEFIDTLKAARETVAIGSKRAVVKKRRAARRVPA